MLFPILLSGAVLILGGVMCGRCKNAASLDLLTILLLTGVLSSYLFFHFYPWKNTLGRNIFSGCAVLLLFGFGILCGKSITKALHRKDW